VLLTRPPLDWKELPPSASLDLHVLSTPPAFILSQDQTLHLKVFQRRRPKPATVDPSQSCFFPTGKLWFLKNQEKDVWHALLSFQGTGSPGFETHPRTTPFSRRPRLESSAKRRTISIAESDPSVNEFVR
jgi:hypothetical protein